MRLMLRLTLENIRLVFSSHLVLYALVLFHKDDMAETKKRILTRGKNLFLGESHVVLMKDPFNGSFLDVQGCNAY